ncbi:hypothetical protein FF1_014637 [Malus domestica]|uniref:Uncharacterized protein n=1 Tax=Malus domestica TaxID=3750 RepID=A0A498I1I8_MALDO|nr:hypothetical protein DVH24_019868 [Malus domestica]
MLAPHRPAPPSSNNWHFQRPRQQAQSLGLLPSPPHQLPNRPSCYASPLSSKPRSLQPRANQVNPTRIRARAPDLDLWRIGLRIDPIEPPAGPWTGPGSD